nr:transposon-transfer assisting family protein [Clostridioides sp.]
MYFNDEQVNLMNLFRRDNKKKLEEDLNKALNETNNGYIQYLINKTLYDLNDITEEEFKDINFDI